jgi:hypothetical protein
MAPLHYSAAKRLLGEFIHPSPVVKDLWERATVHQAEIQVDAEKIEWRKVSNETLVLLAVGHLEINGAVEKFLPQSLSLSWFGLHRLFKFYLLRKEIALGVPSDLTSSYSVFYEYGRGAIGEINHRLSSRPHAATVVLASYFLNHRGEKAAELIRDESLKMLAAQARRRISNRNNLRQKDIVGQAANTIWESFNDPVVTMVQVLNGFKKDQIATAIANDCKDQQRPFIPQPIRQLLRRNSKIERQAKNDGRAPNATERQDIDDNLEEIFRLRKQLGRAKITEIGSHDGNPEMIVALKKTVRRFINEHPKKWARVEAEMNDISNKDYARQKGKTESAASQELTNALKALKRYLSE